MLPALAEAVLSMARSEKQWVADISKYCEKLLDDGQIFFRPDKNGQILPHLVGKNGRIVKQVRLKEIVAMPELLPNLQHLEAHAALAMIMSQLENVQEQIAQIRGELQQDRLAKADAAWDQLNQALKITDGRRREQAVMIAIGAGTEAKRTLMRHFAGCRALIEGNADQSEWQLILGDLFKGKAKKERGEIEARMAYDDLAGILNCVRVETAGHMSIGYTDPAQRPLKEFAAFIEAERLDDRDTILKIDSRLPAEGKRPDIVDEFDAIAQRTMQLSALPKEGNVPKNLLEPYRPPQNEDEDMGIVEEADASETYNKNFAYYGEDSGVNDRRSGKGRGKRQGVSMSIRKKKVCATCGAEIPRNAKQDRCDACIAQTADKKRDIIKAIAMAALTTTAAIAGRVTLKLVKE
ncbi:MAG: hypothetical protein MR429_06485 [Bifidobacterium animalis]|nr:hypothetical protein [Bifidobacterium animalis]